MILLTIWWDMNNFAKDYISLMIRQVDEEIRYLTAHGHNKSTLYEPCMFCVKRKVNVYSCNRIEILTSFKESLLSQKPRPALNRAPIGGIAAPDRAELRWLIANVFQDGISAPDRAEIRENFPSNMMPVSPIVSNLPLMYPKL